MENETNQTNIGAADPQPAYNQADMLNANTQGWVGASDFCNRSKYWKECSVEEKLERLRQELKSLRGTVTRDIDKLDRLNVAFAAHDHAQNGIPMVPARSIKESRMYDIGQKLASRLDDDEAYF